jgi:nitrite reductase/ring-hydroxylating ferredoxin subunit
MDTTTPDFVHACSLEESKDKGRLVVHGRHRPVLLVYEDGGVFALDNRCPHMGFPLERGSVEDGILTCHWHHARVELASGCTFDLWADDVPTCPVEIRAGGEIWVKPVFGYPDPVGHWRRLEDGLGHNLSLVIAKAVQGQLVAGQSSSDVLRQVALFGTRNRDGWDTGLTILTALSQLLPLLSEEDTHLALFHGARRVAADCDGATPRREREPLASRPDLATLKRWLRRWVSVRHRDAAERTVLTAIASGASPAALSDLIFAAETDCAYADGGHSRDFINKAFECLDAVGLGNRPPRLYLRERRPPGAQADGHREARARRRGPGAPSRRNGALSCPIPRCTAGVAAGRKRRRTRRLARRDRGDPRCSARHL